mmetsp:Transcript_43176/g.69248  ORF Transcript_43176/g.69248 Transcript_43176/m.69248 type:complete len:512 (-) Transcript_43176:112-1647(-)|eukprot:CAMPEP_0203760102 /NCGR_PEP_ID=MMETSP0098-20131031/13479_1 /ASSEMBLY_ACC=CAM_ASM_000208 /TAXON_ID=96639 /ORGANISM=" , Strain NY0313808BC1" /LENGTH=511 /DNA_ID=CAMNT_0050653553 /DNA_START=14 /DNA_END=1549 /DNA_ORIENTATION=+
MDPSKDTAQLITLTIALGLLISLCLWFYTGAPSKEAIINASKRTQVAGRHAGRKIGLSKLEGGILKVSKRANGAMKVGTVLRVEGPRFDKSNVGKALKDLQARHPLLGCKIEQDGGEFYMQECPDTNISQAWQTRHDDSTWREVWMKVSHTTPPLGRSPLELYFFEQDSQVGDIKTDILFVMDHFFCDGLSVTNFFKEFMLLFASYDEETKKDDPEVTGKAEQLRKTQLVWQSPMEDLCNRSYKTTLHQMVDCAYYIIRYLLIQHPMVDFTIDKPDVTAAEMPQVCHCYPYELELDVDTTKRLLANCRKNSCTIGAAIASSVLYATRDLVSRQKDVKDLLDNDIAVPLALDMRRRYSESVEGTNLGFHVSSNKAYKYRLGEALNEGEVCQEALFYRAKEMLACYHKFDYAGLALGSVLGPFFEAPPSFDRMSSIAITNWGRLDLPTSVSKWRLCNLFGLINNCHFRMPTLICSSHGGKLHFTLVISEPVIVRSSAELFLSDVDKYLCVMSK